MLYYFLNSYWLLGVRIWIGFRSSSGTFWDDDFQRISKSSINNAHDLDELLLASIVHLDCLQQDAWMTATLNRMK